MKQNKNNTSFVLHMSKESHVLISSRILKANTRRVLRYSRFNINKWMRREKEEKETSQGKAVSRPVAFSSATTRRSCYGNHCERLNISRVHDCEKWVGKRIMVMLQWWFFYLWSFHISFPNHIRKLPHKHGTH